MEYPRTITRKEFEEATEALWSEIVYQNTLPKRTEDEAKDIPGFITLGNRYVRKIEDDWSDQSADEKSGQVEDALDGLRKVSTIFLRAMIYCGIRWR